MTRRMPRQLTGGAAKPAAAEPDFAENPGVSWKRGHFASVTLETVAVTRRLHSYLGNHQDLGTLSLARCSEDPR